MVTNAGKSTRATVENNRREAVRMRTEGLSYREIGEQLGLSHQRVHQLVQEALAELPRESANLLFTMTFERMEMAFAEVHDAMMLRVPLRDRNGKLLLDVDGDGRPIMVPLDPLTLNTLAWSAFNMAEKIARFSGVQAPDKQSVGIEHTGEVTMIGGGQFMFPVKDEADFAAQVKATQPPKKKA